LVPQNGLNSKHQVEIVPKLLTNQMVGVTTLTADSIKRHGRNRMHSRLQQKYVLPRSRGKSTLLQKGESIGTTVKPEKVYGACHKRTKMLSTVQQKQMGNLSTRILLTIEPLQHWRYKLSYPLQ
jgi:hypothetical protein